MIIRTDLIAEIARFGTRIPTEYGKKSDTHEDVRKSLYELSFSVFGGQIGLLYHQCSTLNMGYIMEISSGH